MKKPLFWPLLASILVLSKSISCEPVPKPSADGSLESKLKFIRYLAKGSWAEMLRSMNAEEKFEHRNETNSNVSRYEASWRIIESMSRLKVLGLEEEFAQAKGWLVSGVLDVSNTTLVIYDLAQTTISGLLSCYAQTGDGLFLNKSVQVANMLEQYYDPQTGIARPAEHNTHPSNAPLNFTWQMSNWFTGQQLENAYLSNLTGNPVYANRNVALRSFLTQLNKPHGLYMDAFNFANKAWHSTQQSSLEQHYNLLLSLVQSYTQSNGKDVEALKMYVDIMNAVQKNGLILNTKNGWTFSRTFNNSDRSYGNYMDITDCAFGAVLSKGAKALKRAGSQIAGTEESKLARIRLHKEWARNLTETCRQASLLSRSPKGITPYQFSFTESGDFEKLETSHFQYPYLPRSYYVLSRLTNETEKYRSYAWEMVEAIYDDLVKVSPNGETKFETKPIAFLGTLQYLYLTLADKTVFPVDKWVFTIYNLPLPVLK